MFESSENTIIKAKYFRFNKEQSYQSKNQLAPSPEDEQECFTPQFRGPEKIGDVQPLRKTDKFENFAKMYNQYFKSTSTATKSPNENDSKNPQNSGNEMNLFLKSESSQMYSTPQKYQHFSGVESKQNANSNYTTTSKEFLFINSPLQSYSTPLDFDNPELVLPNNAQILKHHIEKAKSQTQKLKDEQLKLKLQKVKIAAKKSQNQTMKLIPLKIQHQRLKKQIEKLIQEKEILEMNKKMKENSKSSDIKINGMDFKVIKHIPGTLYSQKQLDYQKEDPIEQSRVVKKSSNMSFIQNNPPFSSYSNTSLPSNKNLPMGNKVQGQGFQVGTTAQSPTYFAAKKYPANNDQPTRSMNNIPNQQVKSLTGASLIHSQMQKMRQNELNRSQEKTSKSAFLTFAKASLKNGNSRPTFCKNPSSQIVQNSNSSIQGMTEGSKSALSNGSNQVVTNYANRPVASTSHSPRNQSQYQ